MTPSTTKPAGIIYLTNKQSGVIYAYENHAYWDKEKKQSRSKRICIGKVDPGTGAIVPTRKKKHTSLVKQPPATRGPIPCHIVKHSFYGATYLFDAIGSKLGITADLKACFPDTYKAILSIAYFLILEENNSLLRFEKWGATHKHPWGQDIPSQLSSRIFQHISEESKLDFFRRQGRRRSETEYWAYDISTISSFSECLQQVQYGLNKEHDHLPQFNLALLFGETSNLPFGYRILPGNMPDVKTVKQLIAELDVYGIHKVKLAMDRGFYSEDNINALYHNHIKFLLAARTSLCLIQDALRTVHDTLPTYPHYDENFEIYATTVRGTWLYKEQQPYTGRTKKANRRLYIHVYYSVERAMEEQKKMEHTITKLRHELTDGKRVPAHEKAYQKYFIIKITPVRGTKIMVREDVLKKQSYSYGYFALISNEAMDAMTALKIYRNRDVVEKAFGNIKERLNFRRALVSSELSLKGKVFVEFIALIYLSYIKKQMQDHNLFKKYTLQGLLDKLDVVEAYEYPERELHCSELLEAQKVIYASMGVDPPPSL